MKPSTKKTKKDKGNPEFISIKNLAKRWDISKTTIYDWKDNGKIPHLRLEFPGYKKNKYLIPMDWVLKMEKKCYVRASRKFRKKTDLSPEAVLDDGPDSPEPATETERAA